MNNEEVILTNDDFSLHRILKTDIKKDPNVEEDEIIFGCGCFWGAEKCFWKLPGVVTTAVGMLFWAVRHPVYAIALGPLAVFAMLNFVIGNRAIFYSAPAVWFGLAFIIITAGRAYINYSKPYKRN